MTLRRSQSAPSGLAIGLAASLLACSRGSYVHRDGPGPAPVSGPALPEDVEFSLVPEFDGPCTKRTSIDVNLGHAPEAFVRAAHCQINGTEPTPELVASWSEQLRTVNWVRRIDVVRSLCSAAGNGCSLAYSDPWQAQVSLTAECVRKGTRDVGAVMMFFSDCPGGVNCDPNWANTHASGMVLPHRLFGFAERAEGFYNPDNPGFWQRELLDARWAGLQFLLLNTYGPDLHFLSALNDALLEIEGGIRIAFMDDTWSWGRVEQEPWQTVPDLADTEGAARAIYRAKWKPFFEAVDPENWYRVIDRPLVYFYNAGTLKPLNRSGAVVARLKQLFMTDFGVEPFVAVDRAYFQDPGMPQVADSEFIWDTFAANGRSHFDLKGVSHDHFMVKWDSLGRDRPGAIATSSDRLAKSTALLSQALVDSAASDLAVFGTWNDLGEGTGINRNYDYYDAGQWLPPQAFMLLLRSAQCE
jgi:hypothetical protein